MFFKVPVSHFLFQLFAQFRLSALQKFQLFALFGINWHALCQSECRNFCMYIIIALIFTTKDHYVKLSFQWSDGGVQFVYWVQTFMTIKRYSVEKIIITKKFQATGDLLCWAALAHRPGKWSYQREWLPGSTRPIGMQFVEHPIIRS